MKAIDIRTSRNGEIVDALCINKANGQQLNAVLTLAEAGDEVLVVVKDVPIPNPEM